MIASAIFRNVFKGAKSTFRVIGGASTEAECFSIDEIYETFQDGVGEGVMRARETNAPLQSHLPKWTPNNSEGVWCHS